ncbi:MAG TPA: hypothetical protein VFT65_17880 [Candidatus Angelobacter sp.]|nr:hypothetical protein [Candidatus Angelobacter sp.]
MLSQHMSLALLNRDLWILGIALQTLLAAVLLVKRSWRKYPAFTGYVLFNLFAAVAMYPLFPNKVLYFYGYWICEAIGIVLGLGVVREIFTNVFSPHPALRQLATLIFRVAIVILVVLAIGVIYAQSGSTSSIANAILLAEEATRIVEVGLVMFLFLSSSAFGLHWRQSVFGMALGLGMFAAADLVTATLIGHVGPALVQGFNLAHGIAFATSLLIWLGYLLAPERVTNHQDVPKKAQLEQWNQAVMELISR